MKEVWDTVCAVRCCCCLESEFYLLLFSCWVSSCHHLLTVSVGC